MLLYKSFILGTLLITAVSLDSQQELRVDVCVCVCFIDSLSPTSLVMEVLRTLCDRTECAVESLYQIPVIETLLAPIISLLKGKLVSTIEMLP